MSFFDYHFITRWQIRGPIEVIYSILKKGERYSEWWSAYTRTQEIRKNVIEVLVRAKLPYTLKFTSELISETPPGGNPPHGFILKASGDLVGTGRWELRALGDITEVFFYWDVRVDKKIIRWFSFLLKPLFVWNHNWVMKEGEKGLQKEVERSNQPPHG